MLVYLNLNRRATVLVGKYIGEMGQHWHIKGVLVFQS